MSQHRGWARKIDKSQQGIVGYLRGLPGVEVELDHDDFLVGYNQMVFWFECKSEDALSKVTGQVLESKKTKRQKRLDRTWTGQRDYVTTAQEIIEIIGYPL
jgi:hypothetical protein